MVWSHYQWWSLTSNRSPRGLIYRPQTKARTIRSHCQTRRWCSSKPDPPDLLQSSRWCLAISAGVLEADLSPHGSIRSAGTREYRWLMLSSWLETDRFGGKSQWRDATADRFAPWWWWIYRQSRFLLSYYWVYVKQLICTSLRRLTCGSCLVILLKTW